MRSILIVFLVTGLLVPTTACFHFFREVKPKALDPQETAVRVETPVKVHLSDGRTALFPSGASFTADSILGTGTLYELDLRRAVAETAIRGLPLDDVAALETYDQNIRPVESLVASTLATGGMVLGAAAAAVAIFGSCPTIYTEGDEGALLEAEAFPNSIVPLFEMRDVDLILAQDVQAGIFELEVRNEALETHYINHMELLEVVHPRGTAAVPDNNGVVWVLEDVRTPDAAVDRAGRDVLAELAAADDRHFASLTTVPLDEGDLSDYIDLTVAAPEADSAALYLRLRNSLLGTVYFYDVMLDGQGANALNWLGDDLNSVAGAVRLGGFFQKYMGLRVEVLRDGAYEQVGRVREVGPIAFDHVAVAVPVPAGDSLRVRLRFITDAWRIDQVAVGRLRGPASVRRIAAATVRSAENETDMLGRLAYPDEDYAVTSPGDRFWIGFPTEATGHRADALRTLLVATQGYYTEWIRGPWLKDDIRGKPFEPTASSLHEAMVRWYGVRSDFEKRFDETKIPVR